MSDRIVSRPYFRATCCERCVFHQGEHAADCDERKRCIHCDEAADGAEGTIWCAKCLDWWRKAYAQDEAAGRWTFPLAELREWVKE